MTAAWDGSVRGPRRRCCGRLRQHLSLTGPRGAEGGEGRTRAQPSRPMAVCAGSERAPRPHPGVAGGEPETRHAGRIHATETGKLQIRAPPRRKALAERMRPGTHRWLLRQSQAPPRSAPERKTPFLPRACFLGTRIRTPGELRWARLQTQPAPAAGTSGLTFHT